MEKVTLTTPIKRGDKEISEISIRVPNAGSLRGISLTDLASLDVNVVLKLLPRITHPVINEQEGENLSLHDLMLIGGQIVKPLGESAGNDTTPKT